MSLAPSAIPAHANQTLAAVIVPLGGLLDLGGPRSGVSDVVQKLERGPALHTLDVMPHYDVAVPEEKKPLWPFGIHQLPSAGGKKYRGEERFPAQEGRDVEPYCSLKARADSRCESSDRTPTTHARGWLRHDKL